MNGKLADEYCGCRKTSLNIHDLFFYMRCPPLTPLATQQQIMPDNNRTLLMSAAKGGSVALCEDILKHTSLGINTQNSKGYTALHFACFQGHTDVALLLLAHGSDMYIRNQYRETAIEAAQAAGFHFLGEKLLNAFLAPILVSASTSAHALDALLVPQMIEMHGRVEELLNVHSIENNIQCSAKKRPRVECSNHTRNATFHQRQNILQWQDVPPTPDSSTDLMALLLGSLHKPLEIAEVLPQLPSTSKDNITTSAALINCVLEVASCDEGCTNVPPGLSFDFSDLIQGKSGELSFSIGRSSKSDICLSDLSISKQHASLLFLAGEGVCVTDSSKHGTFVNDSKVHHQSGDSHILFKHSFLKRVGDILNVGRVHLVLKKKVTKKRGATMSQGFRPNQQLGEQLVGALKQQQLYESKQLKARGASRAVLTQWQTEQNVSSRILAKQLELGGSVAGSAQCTSSSGAGGRAETTLSSCSSTSTSLDFESTSFVGRTMLTSLGWKEGSALGKAGGAAKSLVSVPKRSSTSGLGAKDCRSGSGQGQECRNYEGDVWKKTQARYNNIANNSQES